MSSSFIGNEKARQIAQPNHTHRSKIFSIVYHKIYAYTITTSLLHLHYCPVCMPVCGCILQTLNISQHDTMLVLHKQTSFQALPSAFFPMVHLFSNMELLGVKLVREYFAVIYLLHESEPKEL